MWLLEPIILLSLSMSAVTLLCLAGFGWVNEVLGSAENNKPIGGTGPDIAAVDRQEPADFATSCQRDWKEAA